jgi:hypothetical protein
MVRERISRHVRGRKALRKKKSLDRSLHPISSCSRYWRVEPERGGRWVRSRTGGRWRACCAVASPAVAGLAGERVVAALSMSCRVLCGRCSVVGAGQLDVAVVVRQSLSRLWVPHSSFHSAAQAVSPRRMNRRPPCTVLTWPKTGSMVRLRWA